MPRFMLASLAVAVILLVSQAQAQSYNGLAVTPQMGWVSV